MSCCFGSWEQGLVNDTSGKLLQRKGSENFAGSVMAICFSLYVSLFRGMCRWFVIFPV